MIATEPLMELILFSSVRMMADEMMFPHRSAMGDGQQTNQQLNEIE